MPAGCFEMGTDDADAAAASALDAPSWAIDRITSEQPAHEVCLSSGYWIDATEVTNAAYDAFVSDAGYTTTAWWSRDGLAWLEGRDLDRLPATCGANTEPDAPRACVTWYEAEAYAAWRGGTLPTEAQWEFAARGPGVARLPLGRRVGRDDGERGRCHRGDPGWFVPGRGQLGRRDRPVRQRHGVGRRLVVRGIRDRIGNRPDGPGIRPHQDRKGRLVRQQPRRRASRLPALRRPARLPGPPHRIPHRRSRRTHAEQPRTLPAMPGVLAKYVDAFVDAVAADLGELSADRSPAGRHDRSRRHRGGRHRQRRPAHQRRARGVARRHRTAARRRRFSSIPPSCARVRFSPASADGSTPRACCSTSCSRRTRATVVAALRATTTSGSASPTRRRPSTSCRRPTRSRRSTATAACCSEHSTPPASPDRAGRPGARHRRPRAAAAATDAPATPVAPVELPPQRPDRGVARRARRARRAADREDRRPPAHQPAAHPEAPRGARHADAGDEPPPRLHREPRHRQDDGGPVAEPDHAHARAGVEGAPGRDRSLAPRRRLRRTDRHRRLARSWSRRSEARS